MLKVLFWEQRIGKCIPRMKNKFDYISMMNQPIIETVEIEFKY